VEADLVDGRELVRRSGAFPLSRPVHPDPVPAPLAAAASTRPRFAVGALVRVRNLHPRGHTRCPDYVRDRVGEVVRVDPDNPVPEIEAHLGERVLEPTYCVAFSSAELWGGDAADSASVRIDLYERYLEEA
jgi:nitrile hydratase